MATVGFKGLSTLFSEAACIEYWLSTVCV